MNPLKKYLADLLSLLRALALVPVIVFSIMGNWHIAFLVLLIGWATDLVDGIFAKRYGSFSAERDIDADGIADSVLAFGSSAVPVIYAYHTHHVLIGVLLTALYLATVVFGTMMARNMNKALTTRLRWLIAGNMIVLHAIVQIGATLIWFDYMASGAEMALRFAGLLAIVAALQFRKMRLWWVGRFS